MIIRYSTDKAEPGELPISAIKVDGGTQSRAGISDSVVADYAAALEGGAIFPAVKVFYDGTTYWLADGFHRIAAHKQLGRSAIAAEVLQGTRRDAILHSVGANALHGLRRTNEDKRRAILVLLGDTEWSRWSDREIARQCNVGHPLVASLRPKLADTGISSSMDRTFIHPKTGLPTQMRTANIGSAHFAADVRSTDADDITEEDLANDPGFQKAVEALNNAKALYEEAQAMPAAEPPTPEVEAQWKRAFGTVEDRSNLMAVLNATKLLETLPEPEAVAASVPPTMTHAVDVIAVLNLSTWFEKFARAWERRKGASA